MPSSISYPFLSAGGWPWYMKTMTLRRSTGGEVCVHVCERMNKTDSVVRNRVKLMAFTEPGIADFSFCVVEVYR